VKKHIYPILAAHRRKLGISQRELALLAGLRREKLNRIENKAEDVGIEELSRLLEALGLELYVREKSAAEAGDASPPSRQVASSSERRLPPQDFRKAALIDGAKAKIVSWGRVPS
jgi:transcriptional regulator with XRE-family HTH domain